MENEVSNGNVVLESKQKIVEAPKILEDPDLSYEKDVKIQKHFEDDEKIVKDIQQSKIEDLKSKEISNFYVVLVYPDLDISEKQVDRNEPSN